ncbi:MAG: hypothetical protein OEW45_23560, partial [Deltaproteobacteria bacterium]|nr:hypothetical protein [Deltaproteobacteria bacterium]
ALVVTAPERETAKIIAALQAEGIPASVIGKIQVKEKGVKLVRQGKEEDLPIFDRDEVARFFERNES